MHGPVAAGKCMDCHDPHASDNAGLLKKEPAALCLDCHADVKKKPHVDRRVLRRRAPAGRREEGEAAEDPLRRGKPFYCASCHEPHRSELPRLNRFGKGMSACQKCHKM